MWPLPTATADLVHILGENGTQCTSTACTLVGANVSSIPLRPAQHITASLCPQLHVETTNIRCVSPWLQMFSLTQHQFFQLNPGLGMSIQRGAVVCVRGLTDVSTHAMSAFWPVAIGGALAVAGIAAAAYAKISSSRHQHTGTGS